MQLSDDDKRERWEQDGLTTTPFLLFVMGMEKEK